MHECMYEAGEFSVDISLRLGGGERRRGGGLASQALEGGAKRLADGLVGNITDRCDGGSR